MYGAGIMHSHMQPPLKSELRKRIVLAKALFRQAAGERGATAASKLDTRVYWISAWNGQDTVLYCTVLY